MSGAIDLSEKLSTFSEHWSPRTVTQFNNCDVMVVKVKGEFVWHHHEVEDELFLILKGTLRIKYFDGDQEREVRLGEGEFVIVPHGVEHKPVADEEVHLLLLEPKTTLNTGNVQNERTVAELQKI
jgi:mannose-6-phosphate isomerase-like protein (cupin superfamily)